VSVESHLAAATEFIAIAEAADSSSVAYRKAAEEIQAAMDEDATLTQEKVAGRLGKTQRYVGRLLDALRRARLSGEFRVDWGSGSNRRADVAAKTATERPEEFAAAFRQAPPEAKREIAERILADRAVVDDVLARPSKASRLVEQAVHLKDADERKRQAQRANVRAQDGAAPLPAYMASMVTKMNEWSLGLAGLVDDLDDLPEGRGRELVLAAARNLGEQAQRWVDRLERRPELEVIEGAASA